MNLRKTLILLLFMLLLSPGVISQQGKAVPPAGAFCDRPKACRLRLRNARCGRSVPLRQPANAAVKSTTQYKEHER